MSEKPSPREQYEEVELTYLERRNALRETERKGNYPADQLDAKERRLMRLRAARETLHGFAMAEPDAHLAVTPQDAPASHSAQENAA